MVPPGWDSAQANAQIENLKLSITKLQYANGRDVWQDGPGNPTPVAMSKTIWPPSPNNPSVSVFVSGDKIAATATFNVTPTPVSAVSGVRIEGAVQNMGVLEASDVSIPAGATSISVNLTGNTAFPASTTLYFPKLGVIWLFSQSGQPCSTGPSTCTSAGSTSSEVYVTLAAPSGVSESVMPLTAVKLAIGSGGATTQAGALQNTWQRFLGPANVDGWDGRPLYYYEQGVGFQGCAINSIQLLTSPTGSGQCGSWANLFMDALAINGITSSFIQIQATDKSSMLINNWTFNVPSHLYQAPYNWNLILPNEGVNVGPGMVPLSSVSGDITSDSGLPGQNSPTPSEKLFGLHFIVQAPPGSSSGYYDPSYGVQYTGPCGVPDGFESNSIAGYAFPASSDSPTASTWDFGVRQPSGPCNITFTTRFTN
jgi:hypothetical protein